MLKRTLLLLFILPFCSSAEVITVCNGCSHADNKSAAMASTPYLEDVHILNFETGYVNSYRIDMEYIEGFEMKLAIPVTTPSEIQQATLELKNLVDDVTSRGGNFNYSSNTLIDTITIPSDIAGSAHEVASDYEKSQAVSNFIRVNRIPSVWNVARKGYDKVFHKIIYKVKVEFSDQSVAIYVLGPAFFQIIHLFLIDLLLKIAKIIQ